METRALEIGPGSAVEPPAEDDSPRVAVIGTGAWGTTLALLVAHSEPVIFFARSAETAGRIEHEHRNGRRLPGIDLPGRILVSADPGAVGAAADLVIVAVPSAYVREV